MSGELFYGMNEGIIFVLLFALILGAVEIGFRLGRRVHPSKKEPTRSQYATIQAAVLGLLALLLGFTFSRSMSRYETRRQLVVGEANAIGTAFLRTRFLPEPQRTEITTLLRRYVDVLLSFYQAGIDPDKLRETNKETNQIQNTLWSHAVAAGEKDSRSSPVALFIDSLNDALAPLFLQPFSRPGAYRAGQSAPRQPDHRLPPLRTLPRAGAVPLADYSVRSRQS